MNQLLQTDTSRSLLQEVLEEIESCSLNQNKLAGIPTGIDDLDYLTRGLPKNQLTIISGKILSGKRTLVRTIINHHLKEQLSQVYWISNFGHSKLIMTQLISALSEVSIDKLFNGEISLNDVKRIQENVQYLEKDFLHIEDVSVFNINDLKAKLDSLVILSKDETLQSRILVIDDLNKLIKDSIETNRKFNCLNVLVLLRNYAMEYGFTIVCLSNSDGNDTASRNDWRPIYPNDYFCKEKLTLYCALFMVTYVEHYESHSKEDEGVQDVIVLKNNQGSLGTAKLFRARNSGTLNKIPYIF